MIELQAIAGFLEEFFSIPQHADEQTLIRPSSGPVRRIGLALEPWPGLGEWAAEHEIDAVFLHRARLLQDDQISEEIGVVSSHLGFDERLTLGFNPRLAKSLGMSAISTLGKKDGRPCGMIGNVRPRSVARCFQTIHAVFGGYEEAHTCVQDTVTRIAVVGAINRTLVHQASERGACVYVTGQYRQPGRIGVLETGIGVVIVGHQRSEEWGLRALAGVLRERWAGLHVVVAPSHQIK